MTRWRVLQQVTLMVWFFLSSVGMWQFVVAELKGYIRCLLPLSEARRFLLRFPFPCFPLGTCCDQHHCSRTTTPLGPMHAGSEKAGVKDVKAITISITAVISPDNRECEWTGLYPLVLLPPSALRFLRCSSSSCFLLQPSVTTVFLFSIQEDTVCSHYCLNVNQVNWLGSWDEIIAPSTKSDMKSWCCVLGICEDLLPFSCICVLDWRHFKTVLLD